MESQITLKSRGNLPDSHPCFLQYTGKPSGFRRIPDKFFSQLGRCGGGVNPLNTSSMFSFLSTCESFPTMGIPGLLSRILVVASDSHIDGSHGISRALDIPWGPSRSQSSILILQIIPSGYQLVELAGLDRLFPAPIPPGIVHAIRFVPRIVQLARLTFAMRQEVWKHGFLHSKPIRLWNVIGF